MEAETSPREDVARDLDRLWRNDGQRLWRAVFAFAHDRAIVDDAVAEAFAQCLARGEAVRDPGAWIRRAAFRIAAGQLQDRRRWTALTPDPIEPSEPPVEPPGSLVAALRELPEQQRAALVLRYYVGCPTDEIAEILGAGRATVRVHLSRGRRRLRTLLEDHDG
jgi:RNA polymerase sigma-70 factor (ECF subfamily)